MGMSLHDVARHTAEVTAQARADLVSAVRRAASAGMTQTEIARQIVTALLGAGVQIVFVTHMFALAEVLRHDAGASAVFLRADREPDGRRTFHLLPGTPERTSYGDDLYRRIFGAR